MTQHNPNAIQHNATKHPNQEFREAQKERERERERESFRFLEH
jgi:hypothetical protein